jgi:hypothetical protein
MDCLIIPKNIPWAAFVRQKRRGEGAIIIKQKVASSSTFVV